MNETIKVIQNHRSIRQFKKEKLSDETIKTLVQSAQQASTSSYVQAYSIIGVTDEDKKQQLMEISTQHYVKDNGHLFVFVVDYNRHQQLAQEKDYRVSYDSTENLLVGVVDATLAAENLAVAAESMGLGVVFLGSIRNNMEKVIDILNLPEGTFPLVGMAVGYKEEAGSFKERLPMDTVYFENEYPSFDTVRESLNEYDETVNRYYENRDENKRDDNWSQQVIKKLSNTKKVRMDVHDILKKQGYLGQ